MGLLHKKAWQKLDKNEKKIQQNQKENWLILLITINFKVMKTIS